MHFSEKIHAAILTNDIQMFYMVNEDFEMGMIFALYKDQLLEYVFPFSLEEAESYFYNLAELVAHYVELENWEIIGHIVQTTLSSSNDTTLMLIMDAISQAINEERIEYHE